MVDRDADPEVGGNGFQSDDGRDADGRLPEPLDSAHYPPVEGGPAIVRQGWPLSQPAGTGPVISTPVEYEPVPAAEADAEAGHDHEPPPEQPPAPGGMSTATAGALIGKATPAAEVPESKAATTKAATTKATPTRRGKGETA